MTVDNIKLRNSINAHDYTMVILNRAWSHLVYIFDYYYLVRICKKTLRL